MYMYILLSIKLATGQDLFCISQNKELMNVLMFCLLYAYQITLPYCVNSVLNRQIQAEITQPALLLCSCLLLQLYMNNYCCFISPQ